MAGKTVTIDTEAYELLSRHKREGQSFSQVVKEHFSGAKKGRDLMAVLREVSLSEETLDAIEAPYRNPKALAAVRKGLQEAAEGRAVSIGSFAKYADEE